MIFKITIPMEDIVNVYVNNNDSLLLAAKTLGCSVPTLKKHMFHYGIPSKPKWRLGKGKESKYKQLDNKDWLIKQLETKSFREIANEIGSTEGNISDRVKRYGLRPKNWSHSLYTRQGLRKHYPNGRYGKVSSNWRGGKTKLQVIIRNSKEYDAWRLEVFTRDNFTCTCGKRGGNLQVHHIKPFALILDEYNIKDLDSALKCKELWDKENAITMCIPCHRKTDSFGRGKIFRR